MGLKKNIIYSSVLTSSIYIFQFITYPYVSRVLGVTSIGICNFLQSIVNYFLLFSAFGIYALGIREIAKCNNDRSLINEAFSRLILLNTLLTIASLVIYFICIEFIPQFYIYRKLLYIGALQIFFNMFMIEWFFKGIENFKYVTIRTIFIRILYSIAIFVFIRKPSDYNLYFIIGVLATVVIAFINWYYRRRFVSFKFRSLASVKVYLKPLVYLGSQLLLNSLFSTFNITYLGFMSTKVEVGYYTTATKIQNIIMALFTSATLAIMPRVSSLLSQKKHSEIKILIQKSLSLLFIIAFPFIIYVEIFSSEIIHLIAGAGYEKASVSMRILAPLILTVGLRQILIDQLLVPLRADSNTLINALVGATVNIVLNIILVRYFLSYGSSISLLMAEISVLFCADFFVRKRFGKTIDWKKIMLYVLSFIPLLVCIAIKQVIHTNYFISMLIGLFICLLYTHVNLSYIIRNDIYCSYFLRFKHKIFHVK